ncbi:phage virion morphogenesis protein [Paraburkholderia lycopersici]|uniref:Phage virion morphogenesis (Putative tail completion) protein n=1 Tax=Paraburkholderia lycopersici TaxID=416944 RepID=A0A1G7CQL3_9BURK|nr:phage virion morphogenesis protein [Paraburkholderia lycopersici]SDE41642.1 phage virion morphogenesis (putative tail completion) protein [Paraburkholderia lycopersici]
MDELSALESWAGGLLAQLDGPARRAALRDVARELRKSQQTRIAQQRNPDGTAYTARKPRPKKHLRDKAGRIKRGAMFARIRQARYLRADVDSEGVAIGFVGRVARVARIHQFGESDRIAPNGPEYKYPARVLLGFSDTDLDIVRDVLLKHLVK